MPARIERQIAAMVISPTGGQVAANGRTPIELAVPTGKRWNCNLIFQSTDAAATRNASLALAGAKPAHGLNALAVGPTLVATPYAISPAGTYLAVVAGAGNQVELYKRIGTTGLIFLGLLVDAGGGATNLAFSPDERWLAWTSAGFTNVFATAVSAAGFGATANSVAMAAVAQSPSGLAWSPTGAYVAVTTTVAAAAGRLSVYPFAAGVFGGRIDAPGMTAADSIWGGGPAWAPNESAIAIIYGTAGTAQVYGWPFAAGVFGAVARASALIGMNAGGAGGIAWGPSSTNRILAFGPPTTAGANPARTTAWNGAAWGAMNLLTAPVAVPAGKAVRWLSDSIVLHYLFTGASAATAIIDRVDPASGALLANIQNLAAGILTGLGTVDQSQMPLVNNQLFRLIAGGTGLVVETFLAPAITLFPLIAIAANSRQILTGLTLEEGQRLLIGTPAATDVFALSGSAIEIG